MDTDPYGSSAGPDGGDSGRAGLGALRDRLGQHGPERAGRGLRTLVAGRVAGIFQLSRDTQYRGREAFTASAFSRLAVTHALSAAGDALVTLALAGSLFFDISPHAARGRVALSLLLTMAPFAVVAPFLGPVIDRTKGGRRLMVVVTAGGRAVACLMMARYIHGLLLFPAAFITLVCSKGYVVAKAALVPRAVERSEDLVEANAKLAVGGAIVGFLAAIPGVPILKLLSAATLLRVDAAVYVLCGLAALRIRSVRPEAAEVGASAGAVAAPADGPLTDRPLPNGVLQAAAVAVGSLRFSVGFLTFLVAFAFRRAHAAAWWYGIVLAASVGGNLLGAAIAPRLRSRVREEYILVGSVVAVAATALVAMQFAAFHGYPAAAVLAGVLGVAAGSGKLAFDSMVQREVPSSVQGRAFARFEATFQLVWVVGGLVPVLIAMSLGTGFVTAMAVTAAAVVVYQVGSWLGRHDRLPGWWPGVPRAVHWPSPPAGFGGGVAGGVGEVRTMPDFGYGRDTSTSPTAPAGGREAVAGGTGGAGGTAGAGGSDPPHFGPAAPRPVPPPLSGPPPRPGLDQ